MNVRSSFADACITFVLCSTMQFSFDMYMSVQQPVSLALMQCVLVLMQGHCGG